MAVLKTRTISRRTVDALTVEKDTVFWDSELSGFGVRVYPNGGKTYVVQTRAGGKPARRIAIGRHGVVTAEEARRRAALIVSRIKAGEEPVPEPMTVRQANGPTVAELARRFLEDHVAARCKPATAAAYRFAIEKHILPAFGKLSALAVDRAKVASFHEALRDRPVMANQAIDLLARVYRAAEDRGAVPAGSNPCRQIRKYRARRRERFLTEAEFRRLGRTLDEMEANGEIAVNAAAALRLLLLTGCRRNEILTLRRDAIYPDTGEIRLTDSKTGARTVSLSPEAADVFAGIPRVPGNPFVVAGRAGRHLRSLDGSWQKVRARAGLRDVRLHDLRHSFASRALALGETLPAIGRLLGHSRVETTARYAHLADDSVRQAAIRISDSIADDILGEDWHQFGR
ncbi:MAG: tyrosine-type recombinase/integrase [Rhodospirillaceae bacterium]|nr:tyrosine-type recombinase/integrase [Rhodospirillaceae bacterium]MDE0255001.1 tyrosine-type recombinase/integrase [Rhodospirillaceae bacterium]MDE0619469.1 tyrosine-type recombinase/integrase [Rhodospirillaceae bacterium]